MIYLWGHAGSGNHGCEAIVRTTVKMLESPAVLATAAPEEDRRYGLEEVVTLLPDTPRQLGAVERLRHAVHFKLRHDDAVYIRLAHQDFSSRYVREISVSLSAGTIIVMAARISSASTGGNSNGGARKRSCGAAR